MCNCDQTESPETAYDVAPADCVTGYNEDSVSPYRNYAFAVRALKDIALFNPDPLVRIEAARVLLVDAS